MPALLELVGQSWLATLENRGVGLLLLLEQVGVEPGHEETVEVGLEFHVGQLVQAVAVDGVQVLVDQVGPLYPSLEVPLHLKELRVVLADLSVGTHAFERVNDVRLCVLRFLVLLVV